MQTLIKSQIVCNSLLLSIKFFIKKTKALETILTKTVSNRLEM